MIGAHWLSMLSSRLWLIVAFGLLPFVSAKGQIRFERNGYRLTSIGEKMALNARVVDSRRRPVATSSIRWRMSDPSVASVTREGVVLSRKVGVTKLWAVSGRDSTSAIILVDQWVAKFDFAPALVSLDAVGAKKPVRIMARDAAGQIIGAENRKTTSCRTLDPKVATVAANGEVTAKANGSTWVRCTDRGVSDSVRVVVRQRVDKATIADKTSFSQKQMGDTFRLQLRAQDAQGDAIKDPAVTWASLKPEVITVDPLTGFARSVGPGDTKVIAQAGDVTDTVNVHVGAPAGYTGAIATDTVAALPELSAPRSATLKISSLFPFEAETTTVNVTAHDATGTAVTNPSVLYRSGDTAVMIVLPRGKILPKKAGNAWLVGAFGTVLDSTLVTVRPRAGAKGNVAAEEASTVAFKRPQWDTLALRTKSQSAIKAIRDTMFNSSPVGRVASGRLLAVTGFGGLASHSFRDSTTAEFRTGVLYGGGVEAAPFSWLKLSGAFRTGTLSTSATAGGNDLAVTEAEGELAIRLSPAFAFGGGYGLRAEREGTDPKKPIARQQWKIPRGFVESRLTFVGDAISTLMRVSVLPGASYTGYSQKPNPLSLSGEAGLGVHYGWGRVDMSYYVERFSFPKIGTSTARTRVDQFSMLRFRFGIETPR